jgi:hypothetical protein
MTITSSAIGRYRSLVASAFLALAVLAVTASGAKAQDAERRITSPEPGTSVPVDEPFTVAGDGCPPGSSVTVGTGEFEVTATADDAGAFATTLTLPSTAFDFDAEIFDINEFVISGTCGDVRLGSGVLVPKKPGPSQVAQVPSGSVQTGAGGTARMSQPSLRSGLLAVLCLAGALTVSAWRRRIKRR